MYPHTQPNAACKKMLKRKFRSIAKDIVFPRYRKYWVSLKYVESTLTFT